MIYAQLFWNFLMIGALSFGGGYGMISLVRETVLGHGWLTEAEFLSFIAVSESTPGPLAVNMATFIGSSQGGLVGALCATLGVVLPSFGIILLIAALLRNLMKYAGVEAFLSGVRPCVVAMILATAVTMGLSTLGGFTGLSGGLCPGWPGDSGICPFVGRASALEKENAESAVSHRDDPAFCGVGDIVLGCIKIEQATVLLFRRLVQLQPDGTERFRYLFQRQILRGFDGAGLLGSLIVPALVVYHIHGVLQLSHLCFQRFCAGGGTSPDGRRWCRRPV